MSTVATPTPPTKPPAQQAFGTGFGLLWLLFFLVLIVDRAKLADVWQWLRDLPAGWEVVVWVLTLPWAVGLWIWNSGLDGWLRLALVIAVAVLWTSVAQGPKKAEGR